MNGPTPAALAPGVFVGGRIVSATSARKSMSDLLNWPTWSPACTTRCSFSHAVNSEVPPTNVTPPRRNPTRRIISRRSIVATSFISSPLGIRLSLLEVALIELADGKIGRAGGERHVGQRGILTGRRGHARAIGHEHIRSVPHLIVLVEHGVLCGRPHARRAHLVNAHPGEAGL